jgi:hypothetical protein
MMPMLRVFSSGKSLGMVIGDGVAQEPRAGGLSDRERAKK